MTDRAPANASAVACTHCGLDVPVERQSDGASFCCDGCAAVYAILQGCDLTRYYAVREAAESARPGTTSAAAEAGPPRPGQRSVGHFDDPDFQAAHVTTLGPHRATAELLLERVHCAACVWLVERLPRVVPGVLEARLHLPSRTVQLTWDPSRVKLSAVAAGLDRLGYPPLPSRDRAQRAAQRRSDRAAILRLAVAGALAGNVMLIAFAIYGGHLHGMAPKYQTLFGWTSAVLSGLALAFPGRGFFRAAWTSLRVRRPHMDLPIAIGLSAGFLWSAYATAIGSLEVYFDSITVLVFLLLLGRWVQERQQRVGRDAVQLLFSVAPATACRRRDDGTPEDVPLEAIRPGDVMLVGPGDSIPVDGTIVAGASTVDASMLSGESNPVAVSCGDPVHAGTVNVQAQVAVEATATGRATRAGRLMDLVERAARSRPPSVQRADAIVRWFVPAVLTLAALTVLIWWPIDPHRAMAHAMTLLIITCPCALGLATPLAIVAAIGQAARRGILVKGGAALELLAGRGRLILDKTGTLTEGRLCVVDCVGDRTALARAAALETGTHPIARAMRTEAADAIDACDVEHASEVLGAGVFGRVDGMDVAAGRRDFVVERGATVPEFADRAASAAAETGSSPLFISVDGRVVTVLALGDPLRPEAPAVIAALREAGWTPSILSGDHPSVVRHVGAQLGIAETDCHGAVTPEGKVAHVRAARAAGPTTVVGDGVNDAAALAAATVGVAVHGGTEASLAAADVSLGRPGLAGLAELVHGARRTRRVIGRNLLVSLGYNVVGVSLAMSGAIDPIVAAILMPMSSLTVIASSYRSRTFPEPIAVVAAGASEAPEAPGAAAPPLVDATREAAGDRTAAGMPRTDRAEDRPVAPSAAPAPRRSPSAPMAAARATTLEPSA